MKMLKYILGSLILIGLVACSPNEDKFPIPLSETLGNTGGIVRVISIETAALDVGNLDGAEYAFIAELSDVNDGQDAEAVAFYAAFQDVDGNRVEELASPIVVYESSAFSVDPSSGLPRARLSVPLTSLLSAFGFTAADLNIGDRFELRWELRMKDGRVFSRNDVSSDVGGAGFFASPFFSNVSVVISLPQDMFVGSYTFTQDAPSPGVAGQFSLGWIWADQQSFVAELTVDPNNNLVGRLFDAKPTPATNFGFNIPVATYSMEFGLFTTLAFSLPAGVQCGGVAVRYGTATENRGSFDPTDDSSFNMFVRENTLGACGVPVTEISFTVTKN
jgi:hypothetical protein